MLAKLVVSFFLLSVHSVIVNSEAAVPPNDGARFVYEGFAAANLAMDGLAAVKPNGLLALTNATYQTKAHAFHPVPLRFLNSSATANTTVRSFSTSFVFAILSDHPEVVSDHGLAFVVTPTKNFSSANAGQYLGLFSMADHGDPSDHILAVELDTIMNPEFSDIDSNHVGVDVNSLTSLQAETAGYYDDDTGAFRSLKLNSQEPLRVWVDYDGQARQLNVTLAPAQAPKTKKPLLSADIDLSTVLKDQMYVGFSSATGVVFTHHYVLGWSFSLDGDAPPLDLWKLPALPRVASKRQPKMLHVVLPVCAALLVTALILALVMFLRWRRRYAEVREDWEDEFGPHRFAYKDLFHATQGFADRNLLGAGGFGSVYKGVLPASELEIAVKKVSHDSRQGMKEFIAEVVSIGRVRHRNIVRLLGYCRRKGEFLLVYDYMANGSLDTYIHDKNRPALCWPKRFWIIKGVASGLLYLHNDWEQLVIHRDIKASNVLLDSEMNGVLGDFGLARLYDHGAAARTTHVVGTKGYIAPELIRTGKATPLTDVFAFGVFLLEVTCGQRPIGYDIHGDQVVLMDWVLKHHHDGSILNAVDPRLAGRFSSKEANLVLKLGILCSHPFPGGRPTMDKVVKYLDGALTAPDLSPTYMSYNMMAVMPHKELESHVMWSSSLDTSVGTVSSISVLSEGR